MIVAIELELTPGVVVIVFKIVWCLVGLSVVVEMSTKHAGFVARFKGLLGRLRILGMLLKVLSAWKSQDGPGQHCTVKVYIL